MGIRGAVNSERCGLEVGVEVFVRHRRLGYFARCAPVLATVLLAAFAVAGTSSALPPETTAGSINSMVCNPQCTFGFNSGPGVLTETISAAGPNVGNFASTAIEIIPAEFSQSGDPEINFQSFSQTISNTVDFISTTSTTFFDQTQLVERANAMITVTTTAVIDYSLDYTLEISGGATDGSFVTLQTQWFFAPEGQGGTLLDSGVSDVEVDQGVLILTSTGNHASDIEIVDMGGGLFHASGSGLITTTGIPVNTMPRIGVGVFPSAHLEAGSVNAFANTQAMGTGVQFRLRSLDPSVTITAIPAPEPTSPGMAALVILAGLARLCRSKQA